MHRIQTPSKWRFYYDRIKIKSLKRSMSVLGVSGRSLHTPLVWSNQSAFIPAQVPPHLARGGGEEWGTWPCPLSAVSTVTVRCPRQCSTQRQGEPSVGNFLRRRLWGLSACHGSVISLGSSLHWSGVKPTWFRLPRRIFFTPPYTTLSNPHCTASIPPPILRPLGQILESSLSLSPPCQHPIRVLDWSS